MSTSFDAEVHLDHMAKVMGLTIDPAWRETILANLQVSARLAALVVDFPLDDHVEPAPVFAP